MPKCKLPTTRDWDDLIEPICTLAAIKPGVDEPELAALVEAAKRVKDRRGFAVVTYKL